jgi:membrane protease YdiL (CAAX protease family)
MAARSEMGNGPDSSLRATIRRHQLMVFFVGSVALGSLVTALLALLPASRLMLPLVALPISYIPAVLAVLLVRLGGEADDHRAFRRRLTTWRIGWRWYILGLLIVPSAYLAGVALATFWGGVFPLHLERFALLPLFLITNFGEEIGWRGYALPRLQQHFNSLVSSVLVGVGWAAFHWVALAQNPSQPWGYVVVGSGSLIAMSVVMTWLFNHTGSVVLMVLLHATYDVVSIGVVPLVETTIPLLAFALSGVVLCLIAVILVIVAGPQLGRPNGATVSASTPADSIAPDGRH